MKLCFFRNLTKQKFSPLGNFAKVTITCYHQKKKKIWTITQQVHIVDYMKPFMFYPLKFLPPKPKMGRASITFCCCFVLWIYKIQFRLNDLDKFWQFFGSQKLKMKQNERRRQPNKHTHTRRVQKDIPSMICGAHIHPFLPQPRRGAY